MMTHEDWQRRVVATGITLCPACESTDITLGACAVGATTIHQEYVCETCQHSFSGMFTLLDYYDDGST
jgi:transposase-like protein